MVVFHFLFVFLAEGSELLNGEMECFSEALEKLDSIKLKSSKPREVKGKNFWYEKAFIDGSEKTIGMF